MTKNLLISLFFGALIGVSTAFYTLGLEKISDFHQTHSMYPLVLILVFAIIYLVKRNTLYFPTGVHDVVDSVEIEQKHWSAGSYVFNLIGSWMSHFAGASLGREGTVIVLASSLAHSLRLNWSYFKPIVIAASFACVVGQPLIAVVLVAELFSTNLYQKVFAFIMAWVGVLILKSLNVVSLFTPLEVDLSIGFFNKLLVVVLVGLTAGLMTNIYKQGYLFFSKYFKKNLIVSILVILVLSWIFMLPQMKPLQSLSLETFAQIQKGHSELFFLILKFVFTLLFVSLGFIGGDFVPLIIVGSGFGVLAAQIVGIHYSFGLAMGSLSFFVGVTRLKWTSLWLVFLMTSFWVMAWAYLGLSIARQCSGHLSLYRKMQDIE